MHSLFASKYISQHQIILFIPQHMHEQIIRNEENIVIMCMIQNNLIKVRSFDQEIESYHTFNPI